MILLPHKVGPFTLHRKLGTGGIAEAYAGANEVLAGKPVVVRRILPYVLRDAARLDAIEGRIKDLLGVRHPFLVHMVDHVTEGEEHFIVEEFIDGVTLERVLAWCRQSQHHVPHNVFLNIATQVCNGLEALHGRQGKGTGADHVLHLALKPGAIFLTRDGKVVVGSYGLTRSPTALPHGGVTGPVPTRMEYLSPEQTHPDQKLTPASDIFSLGSVLYELLTLESLFRAESNLQTIHRVRRAEVTTQLLRVKERMPGLDKVLFRALSLNPRHRYQRAFVLREDLRGLMAGYSFATIAEDTRAFLAPLMESLAAPASSVSSAPDAPEGADAFEDQPATRIDPDPMTTAAIAAQALAERVARERELLGRVDDGVPETTETTSPRDERDPPTELQPEPPPPEKDLDRPTVNQDPPSLTGQLPDPSASSPGGRRRHVKAVTPGATPASTAAFLAGDTIAPHPPVPVAEPVATSEPDAFTPLSNPVVPAPEVEALTYRPPPTPNVTLLPPEADAPPPPAVPALEPPPAAAPPAPPAPALSRPMPPPAGFSRPMPGPNIASTPAPVRSAPANAPIAPVAAPLPPPPPPSILDEAEPPRRGGLMVGAAAAAALVAVVTCSGLALIGYRAMYAEEEAPSAVAEAPAPAPVAAPTEDPAAVMAAGAPPRLEPITEEPAAVAVAPAATTDSPVSSNTAAPLQPAATAPPPAPSPSPAPVARPEPTPAPKAVAKSEPAPRPAATPRKSRPEPAYAPEPEPAYVPPPRPKSTPAPVAAAKPVPVPTPSATDVSVTETPVSELDQYADPARKGKLASTDVSVLEMTDIGDPQYTRSRALLLMNAQSKGDDKGTKRYLDQLMQLAENQYNPVYLADYARWYANHGEYDRALDKATLAERYWARLPSELVFTKKAEIYEVQAAAWQGKFYKSGEDLELLGTAIRSWEKYKTHVATRSRSDLQKRADAEIAKLNDIKERIQ